MSNSLYITSLEGQSGKRVLALAFMEQLSGRLEKVSLFRPVVSESGGPDKLIKLMVDLYDLRFSPEEMYGVTMEDAQSLLAVG
ncbi:MAG: AAA family ATPase, partial [Methanoregulaceae archaeon]|nr:AAA family ATPase [Methanoregulaceae archaeon]